MAGVIVIIVVVVLIVATVLKSFHSIGAAEVGTRLEALRFPQALRGQPDRVPR